jgi:hypothetical protein
MLLDPEEKSYTRPGFPRKSLCTKYLIFLFPLLAPLPLSLVVMLESWNIDDSTRLESTRLVL